MTADMWLANLPTLLLFFCALVLAVVMGRPRRDHRDHPRRERLRRPGRRLGQKDVDRGA